MELNQIQVLIDKIKNETVNGANTALRVSNVLTGIKSRLNVLKGTNHIFIMLDGTPEENGIKFRQAIIDAPQLNGDRYAIMTLGGSIDYIDNIPNTLTPIIGSLDPTNVLIIQEIKPTVTSLENIVFNNVYISSAAQNFTLIANCQFNNVEINSRLTSDYFVNNTGTRLYLFNDFQILNVTGNVFENLIIGETATLNILENNKIDLLQVKDFNCGNVENNKIDKLEIENNFVCDNFIGNKINKITGYTFNAQFDCDSNVFSNIHLQEFSCSQAFTNNQLNNGYIKISNILIDHPSNLFINIKNTTFNTSGDISNMPSSRLVNCLNGLNILINQ